MSVTLYDMSKITCEHPSFRIPSQTPMRNFHFYAAKSASVKLKLGSIIDLMLTKNREKSKSVSMMWTKMSQIMCEYPSFRVTHQTLDTKFTLPCSQISLGEAETW